MSVKAKSSRAWARLKYPHVILGVLAIFMYVGGEVSIGSSIINFLGQPSVAGLSAVEASKYVSLFWGGMLIGRFMGAVELSEMKKVNKQIAAGRHSDPRLSAVLGFAQLERGSEQFDFAAGWAIVKNYLPMLALCWVLFQFGQALAGRTLLIFRLDHRGVAGRGHAGRRQAGDVVHRGRRPVHLHRLAEHLLARARRHGRFKSQVSSLLVMAVLGGALLPPLQGKIADILIKGGNEHGLQISYIVPLIAYAYVAFYGDPGPSYWQKGLPWGVNRAWRPKGIEAQVCPWPGGATRARLGPGRTIACISHPDF